MREAVVTVLKGYETGRDERAAPVSRGPEIPAADEYHATHNPPRRHTLSNTQDPNDPRLIVERAEELRADNRRARNAHGRNWRTVHIFRHRRAGADWAHTYCGRPGRSMSHHEVKRNIITCDRCLGAFILDERNGKRREADAMRRRAAVVRGMA